MTSKDHSNKGNIDKNSVESSILGIGFDAIGKVASSSNIIEDLDEEQKERQKQFASDGEKRFFWSQLAKYANQVANALLISGIIGGFLTDDPGKAVEAVAPSGEGIDTAAGVNADTTPDEWTREQKVLGAGLASFGIGMTASYIAHKIGVDNTFDINELNARQTAKYLADELEKRGASLPVTHGDDGDIRRLAEEISSSDGKTASESMSAPTQEILAAESNSSRLYEISDYRTK